MEDQLAWVKSVDFPDVFPVDSFLALMMPLPDFGADFKESIEMKPSRHKVNPRSICGANKSIASVKYGKISRYRCGRKGKCALRIVGMTKFRYSDCTRHCG